MSSLVNHQGQNSACQPDWSAYYDAVEGRPPRETLLQALALFEAEINSEINAQVQVGINAEINAEITVPASIKTSPEPNGTPIDPRSQLAVDLGCGDGRDSAELLQRGWRVLAVDAEPEAIARLHDRFADVLGDRLMIQQSRFESLQLPAAVDLINASFCLPFCPPEQFPSLWRTMVDSLRVGGRLCGQFFGDRDTWATHSNMTFYTRGQLELLLRPLAIEFLEEEDHPGQTALGEEKHWHIFHLVARKLR